MTSDDSMNRLLWVDSLLKDMTLQEKIGQLFMIRAHSDKGEEHIKSVEHQVKNLKVGGICLFQGTREGHEQLINRMKERARIPLFVSIDAEWGLNMRLKSESPFPKAMSLGAATDMNLASRMGKLIAEECRAIGINMNFAPVLDVNNNPENPVINYRSFGENASRVAKFGTEFSIGMIRGGVIPCGKHFPGHGDTSKDSHHDLPVIPKSIQQLEEQEFLPFKSTIRQGIPAIMTAHLHVPSLDSTANLPSSLSKRIVTDILQDSLSFRGLVITDALEMQGVRKHYDDGEIAIRAFKAGNDILLLPKNIQLATAAIKDAIEKNEISMEELDLRVKKILRFKYDYARVEYSPLNIAEDKDELIKDIAEGSVVLLSNQDNIIPFSDDLNKVELFIHGEDPEKNIFSKELSTRMDIDRISSLMSATTQDSETEVTDLNIVALFFDKQKPSNNYGISPQLIKQLNHLSSKSKTLIVYFGNPYGLKELSQFGNIVLAHEDLPAYQLAAAKAITGYTGFKGSLPVTVSPEWIAGKGFFLDAQKVFVHSAPEALGMDREKLDSIRIICERGVRKGAFPSAVVLVAKNGRIVYHNEFGYQTYSQIKPIHKHSVYDLASITKVAATTIALMKLVDQGKLDINKTLGDYLPLVKDSNKEDLIIADILEHRAGLKPWIPFYEGTIKRTRRGRVRLSSKYYKTKQDELYSIPIDGSNFLRNDYVDSIFNQVLESELFEEKKYRYSDLGFYLLYKLVEEVSDKSFEEYLDEEFYEPMNLSTIEFNPHYHSDISQIPPSEYDHYFRGKEIRAYVHDMGAAMMGGVSGHAGLFGSAEHLATIFQMLLNDGEILGQRFLKKETIDLFTKRYKGTRRGMGFDMKELNSKEKKSTNELASDNTFGHYGFTGTAVWADPEEDLIYVFLSNRTYPSMNNIKINKMDIRRKIQGVVYRSLPNDSLKISAH